ncbi:hypothetical protein F5Y01DRAFT_103008 [Xylaria sp. FL0043]|nr:hypothetical protein F5Y01DRAFT_103008 [Xylaria sp. FL0043]
MYFNTNILAVVGLLAAGATAQSSSTSSSTMTSAPSDSSSSTTTAPASSMTMSAVRGGMNGTFPAVWSYFNTTVTSVVVVDQLTTVCKAATTLTFNDCKYTATAGQTLVVTNCPCTVTTTLPTMTSSLCPPGVTPPAQGIPPPVQVAPPPHVTTPTAIVPVSPPNPSYVQVGGASSVVGVSASGLIIAAAAAAVALGF